MASDFDTWLEQRRRAADGQPLDPAGIFDAAVVVHNSLECAGRICESIFGADKYTAADALRVLDAIERERRRQSRWEGMRPAPLEKKSTPEGEKMKGAPKSEPNSPTNTQWDADDVAAYLKASRSWVYQKASQGVLPCIQIGGLLRFDPEAIRKFAHGESTQKGRVVVLPRG